MPRRKTETQNEETMNENTEVNTEETNIEEPDAKIREAFDSAIASNEKEDGIKMAMIMAGATFKNVARLYNTYLVDAGLAMSKEEKNELVGNILDSGDFDVSTQEGFEGAQTALVEQASGLTDRQAASIIRAWAKKNDVEAFKKPAGGGGGRTGFTSTLFDMLKGNPRMTKEEMHDILQSHPEATENSRRIESFYQNVRQLCNDIVA